MYSLKCLLHGFILLSLILSFVTENERRKEGALGKTLSQVIGTDCLPPIIQYMTINFPLCADFLPEHKDTVWATGEDREEQKLLACGSGPISRDPGL